MLLNISARRRIGDEHSYKVDLYAIGSLFLNICKVFEFTLDLTSD